MSAEENQTGEGMEGVLHEMKRESFILSTAVVESLDVLSGNDYAEFARAVLHYCAYGEEPTNLTGDYSALFRAMRIISLDQELEKYDKYMDRRIPKYNDWRKAVYDRDGYTCQCCGKVGGRLNAHHIKSFAEYPELRFDVDNGITLCDRCHRNIHKRRRK